MVKAFPSDVAAAHPLLAHWPMFGLRVRTPRLELRYADDDLVREIAVLAALGVRRHGQRPFDIDWDLVPSPHQERNTLQYFWSERAGWKPTDWHCPFAVLVDGEVVGVQGMFAKDFPRLRTVETGSWLGIAHQGRRIGTEMRAAILHLIFTGLGATTAISAAYDDNPGSQGVSARLGYLDNGRDGRLRGGERAVMVRFSLERTGWEANRRDATREITISGLEPCLPYFGAAEAPWISTPAPGEALELPTA